MKKLVIGFALGLLLTQGVALAQHRHHGHFYHNPGWHMRPHAHGWVVPALVRFFALRRIEPHAPLLVRGPVNSFEF